MKTWWRAAVACGMAGLCIGLGGGCEAETEEGLLVPVFSPLSEPSRSELRTVMGRFDGKGIEGLQLDRVMGIIEGEGVRVFPYEEWTDDFVIQGFGFDLTTTLPETDYWGHQDPTGGYTFFDEDVYESDGDVASQTTVGKRAAELSSGAVGNFSYHDTETALTSTSFRLSEKASFVVSADTTYAETAWHQQESSSRINGGPAHSQGFTYQSHPTMTLTLAVGDRYARHAITDTVISGAKGWKETTSTGGEIRMTGTLALFMPSGANAPDNTDSERDPDNDTQTAGGVTTTTYDETSVQTVENAVGVSGGVLEVRRTVTTHDHEEERDTDSGQVLSENNETHTTEFVTYSLMTGFGTSVLAEKDLEQYAAHVNTTRTLSVRTVTYKNAANTNPSKDEETTTVYRYTSNVATRHDIAAWKSTRHRVVITWAADSDYTVEDEGTEWLISEIVPDPEYDAVPFAWTRKWSESNDTTTFYFGDDASGHQTTTTDTVSEDISGAWDTSAVAVRGSHVVHTASVDNGDDVGHGASANSQGTYTVTVNGQTATLSSEEWLDAVKAP